MFCVHGDQHRFCFKGHPGGVGGVGGGGWKERLLRDKVGSVWVFTSDTILSQTEISTSANDSEEVVTL